MSQPSDPQTWIPLTDYLVGQVRAEKTSGPANLDPDLPAPPAEWITVSDYLLAGNRPPTRAMLVARERNRPPPEPIPPPPPKPPVPVIEAMAAVHAALGGEHPLLRQLAELAARDARELARGEITEETKKSRDTALAIIRDNHARHLEEARDWYLQRYFERFPATLPETEPDAKPS